MPPTRRSESCLILALITLSCLAISAVELVYDELLWTKQLPIWQQAKQPNALLYTNPSDLEPKLLEVYPSIKGCVASSLDGPHTRRDGSDAPADAE